ncbi:hypothetical protein ARMGADRAFT_1070937 [Armillaria gallica]|uniref:Uncharacterized protein n=1 Tax=Armillaria gallica TaxID=47427 RepID=A0A2H3EPU8_ARMGA|nr:hypothetical protein ARMGADRAFT_1070937 [Armillaria gallica]
MCRKRKNQIKNICNLGAYAKKQSRVEDKENTAILQRIPSTDELDLSDDAHKEDIPSSSAPASTSRFRSILKSPQPVEIEEVEDEEKIELFHGKWTGTCTFWRVDFEDVEEEHPADAELDWDGVDEDNTPFSSFGDDDLDIPPPKKKGAFVFPSSLAEAESAFGDLERILKPPHKKGEGYKPHGLSPENYKWLEDMHQFLGVFIQKEKIEEGKREN